MAEISEEPPNPAAHTAEISETRKEPVSDFDQKTMRTTKPGLKRLFLTFSVLLSFLLGCPLLWKSVEIYRAPLPFHDIDAVSNDIESNPLLFPCHFQAIFINSNPESSINLNPRNLQLSILAQITKLTSEAPPCGACANNFTLSLTIDSSDKHCTQSHYDNIEPSCLYRCGGIRAGELDFGDDESVDEALESVLGDKCSGFGGKMYSVVVVSGGDVERVRAVVGKYRHAWIVGRELVEEEMVERVAEMFVKVFVNGGREEGLIHGEFMPVGADGRVVLSFDLLNANPRDWIYDW